jgi:hypothetical protein
MSLTCTVSIPPTAWLYRYTWEPPSSVCCKSIIFDMTTMATTSTVLTTVAPCPNYNNEPTIAVGDHEVPLPTYFMIQNLLEEERPEHEVVGIVFRQTGASVLEIVMEVVNSVAENYRLITTLPTKSPYRFSMAVLKKQKKKHSDYRASRLEARRELQELEEKLEIARQQERRLMNEVSSSPYSSRHWQRWTLSTCRCLEGALLTLLGALYLLSRYRH